MLDMENPFGAKLVLEELPGPSDSMGLEGGKVPWKAEVRLENLQKRRGWARGRWGLAPDTPRPGSAPRPGHQVVEDEEDEDERHGDGEEQAAVVPAGACHAREALGAARQQPRHA